MTSQGPVRIMDAERMSRTVMRIAHEILERGGRGEDLALVGIRTRGVPMARRIAAGIREIDGRDVPVGVLDINLYRDDLSLIAEHPVLRKTEIPFRIEGKRVVLVDDVLFTGRTIRAALDALIDLGRPRLIQLAVLVDRGHRELPIRADFVGKNVPTSQNETIEVRFAETDGEDAVLIRTAAEPAGGRARPREEATGPGPKGGTPSAPRPGAPPAPEPKADGSPREGGGAARPRRSGKGRRKP